MKGYLLCRIAEVAVKLSTSVIACCLLFASIWLIHSQGYGATAVVCTVPGVTVNSDRAEDGELACKAAGKALAFMRHQGFEVNTRFTLDLVDRSLSLHGAEVKGTYDSKRFRIEVPSFSQAQVMAQRHPPFGMNMCEEMWQSFVVHEVAHAVAQANFKVRKPSLEAHEYIAYVVQIATLPEPLRTRLLAKFDNLAFQHERQISRTFLQLEPEVFAVKAYRHFSAHPDPQAFFQRLLN
uniref:DUF6639 family protein n=1 Tax=Marinobacter sp. TaxID=50741 RepID=UPI00356952F4